MTTPSKRGHRHRLPEVFVVRRGIDQVKCRSHLSKSRDVSLSFLPTCTISWLTTSTATTTLSKNERLLKCINSFWRCNALSLRRPKKQKPAKHTNKKPSATAFEAIYFFANDATRRWTLQAITTLQLTVTIVEAQVLAAMKKVAVGWKLVERWWHQFDVCGHSRPSSTNVHCHHFHQHHLPISRLCHVAVLAC